MRLELPPGCTGLDHPSGGTYRPSERGGAVTVDDPVFAASARQAGLSRLGDVSVGFGSAAVAGVVCEVCGHERWPWQEECPKCQTS